MNRDFLEKLGLPKDQVDQIMAEHGKTVQTTQAKLTTAEDRVKALEGDLGNANKLVGDLKKETKDTKELQDKITEYEKKVSDLEVERAKDRKTSKLKDALTAAGANDIEYMMFKLGDVELDKEGNVKDLDNRVKVLKETNPTFFKKEELPPDPKNPAKGGYKPIDTKLPNGKTVTLDINSMSVDQINENWDAIKQQNKK